jgi:hypothetical protein
VPYDLIYASLSKSLVCINVEYNHVYAVFITVQNVMCSLSPSGSD